MPPENENENENDENENERFNCCLNTKLKL